MNRALKLLTGLAALGVLAMLALWFLNTRDETALETGPTTAAAAPADPAQVQRGAYLARAGNCMT
ncbi:MAG: hypothetical protein JWQ72_3581, partial [Polaromonas sp.]|nr:hypothetical protein [Polaromonas sp.]